MKGVKTNWSYILCGTNDSIVRSLRSILYGNWVTFFIVLATSYSMILSFLTHCIFYKLEQNRILQDLMHQILSRIQTSIVRMDTFLKIIMRTKMGQVVVL